MIAQSYRRTVHSGEVRQEGPVEPLPVCAATVCGAFPLRARDADVPKDDLSPQGTVRGESGAFADSSVKPQAGDPSVAAVRGYTVVARQRIP